MYYTINYQYNADGIRTVKEVIDGDMDERYLHEYTLNGSQIVKETVYSAASDDEYSESYTLVYIYDETGAPIGMKYRTPSMAVDTYICYFFEKNLQGDVVSVYNSSGVKVIAYTYDAWGNCTASYPNGSSGITGATYNPFRYRGYYYDTETGFYYLQSRYYNPEWGRFLNADEYVNANGDIVGFNMYAYCSNNPITFVDPTGSIALIDDLVFWGGLLVLSTIILLSVPAICEATECIIQDVCEIVDDAVDYVDEQIKKSNDDHPGEYTVYALKDKDGNIMYVGRTKNLQQRLKRHENSLKTGDLELAYYLPGLTWAESRGLEDLGICFYNTIEFGKNAIRGVSLFNPLRTAYLKSAWNALYNGIAEIYYNATE